MNQKDYQCSITAKVTPAAAFESICRVPAWWVTDFEGRAEKLGDEFTIHFGETLVSMRLVECIAPKKVVWEVTSSWLPWLKNKTEWKGTKIVWEVIPQGESTEVLMTHVGLVPDAECYDDCRQGWNGYIQGSLLKLLTEGKGMPHDKAAVL